MVCLFIKLTLLKKIDKTIHVVTYWNFIGP